MNAGTCKQVLVGLPLLLAAVAGVLALRAQDEAAPAVSLRAQSAVVVAASPETAAPEQEAHLVQATTAQSVRAIEGALVASDPAMRETAFSAVLPGLIANDPRAVVDLVARQAPGGIRDALRDEAVRQWIRYDRAAAGAWIHSLVDPDEQRAAATVAMRALAAGSAPDAVAFADEFGIGRNDGSIAHLIQIWGVEHPDQKFPTPVEAASGGVRSAAE